MKSARAIFDVENDRVILPLDAYNTDGKDEYFTKALELARKKCFAEHGQHYKMFVRTEGAGRNFGRTEGARGQHGADEGSRQELFQS